MRSNTVAQSTTTDVRRALDRLDGIPIRPRTAFAVLDRAESLDVEELPIPARSGRDSRHDPTAVDPGWVLALSRAESEGFHSDLALVAAMPWWHAEKHSAHEAINRLWRYSLAMTLATRRLATAAGDVQPDQLAAAALLSSLGLWAWAAVDASGFADWLNEQDPKRRIDLERRRLGSDHVTLSLRLAERWGCDPLIPDAVWTVHSPALAQLESSPDIARLSLIKQAQGLADATPWALKPRSAAPHEAQNAEPRIRLLIAEVQSRCGGAFVDSDFSRREEQLAKSNARLRLELLETTEQKRAFERFLHHYSTSSPLEDPQTWAEQAGLAWCDEPGVSAARVVWSDQVNSEASSSAPRPPSIILPLAPRGRSVGEVHLWTRGNDALLRDHPAIGAWSRWAGEVAAFDRLAHRIDTVRAALDEQKEIPQEDRRQANLAALAEFAGGAGHELNNPLAVIVGRAQLLLTKQTEPDAIRSLRTIISQAQRINRILRDLIYVARPPELRPKLCQPDEILKNAIRDLQGEAETRSVRFVAELRAEGMPKLWTDPDQLRQIADCLLRNALEATPPGGKIFVSGSGQGDQIEWSFRDEGRGVSESESIHLFDPFFCGRQAGRGLGMGLPRVARIIERSHGDLRWTSTPGRGTSFHVSIPYQDLPRPPGLASVESEPQSRSA